MSGHSKWATTKHKKAAIDAKRGKLFAKLIDNLDDLDDVQNIYSNWTASDEVMAQLDEE